MASKRERIKVFDEILELKKDPQFVKEIKRFIKSC